MLWTSSSSALRYSEFTMFGPRPCAPGRRPRLLREIRRLDAPLELDGFHHLTDEPVTQQHHRIAVVVRQVEGLHHEVRGFLHGGRRQHEHPVVAVPGALRRLQVVGLRRQDAAQPRARRA